MLNKVKNWTMLVLLTFLLISAGMWSHYQKKYREQKAETERVSNNYRVAHDSVRLVKGENGLLARRIEKQALTVAELKAFFMNITADLSDMKIKLRKVESITAFNTETTNNVHTYFRDSLIRDTVKVEFLRYKEKWMDLQVIKEGKDALVKCQVRDSLLQVVHWDYRGKFWPTRWLTSKIYYQDIKSMNPNSKITYSEWIVPIKRRR